MSLSDSTLNVRRAASQFIDDFESAVCDLLPAFAAHAYEAERDAIEDAMDDARTAARHDGASPDEIWDATRAACEAAGPRSSPCPVGPIPSRRCGERHRKRLGS